jgi:hypothetical protein
MKRIALACLLVAAPLASPASAQDVIFRDGFELVCPPDMGDCDGNPADCETSLRTLTDCGACRVPCDMEHGTCLLEHLRARAGLVHRERGHGDACVRRPCELLPAHGPRFQ